MQLIWIPGPTAKALRWRITKAQLCGLAVGLLCLGMLVGGALHVWGWRVAVVRSPAAVQALGGVVSRDEHDRLALQQTQALEALQSELLRMQTQLSQLGTARQSLFDRLGLSSWRPLVDAGGARAGQGGPWKPVRELPAAAEVSPSVFRLNQHAGDLRAVLAQMHADWQAQSRLIELLPLGLPLPEPFHLSSGFGVRADPLVHAPGMHEGLDLVAPTGTPVWATAPGWVSRAGHLGAYGRLVEITHEQGFVTRYAHLEKLLVTEGQRVKRGDAVGQLGNTGRSTGPHLHYELLFKGQAMHPVQALVAWSKLP